MLAFKNVLSLGLALAVCTSGTAFAAYKHQKIPQKSAIYIKNEALEEKAKSFISDLADKGIGVIKNDADSQEQREKSFRSLLVKHFDMKTIGRFALGRYWKTSSKAQQKEYLYLFEDMIVRVYSKRFNEYDGQVINITSARGEGKSDVLVTSMIVPKSGPKVAVDWRVRQKKNGQLKIIDVIVEGVSMSLTQRSDFASVIQRGGGKVEVLLEHLRKDK